VEPLMGDRKGPKKGPPRRAQVEPLMGDRKGPKKGRPGGLKWSRSWVTEKAQLDGVFTIPLSGVGRSCVVFLASPLSAARRRSCVVFLASPFSAARRVWSFNAGRAGVRGRES
jgi:hypothetical protein